jgi:hypothetical protein
MLTRREKYMLAILPPLAIVCVQAFVFQPKIDARIAATDKKLEIKLPDPKAPAAQKLSPEALQQQVAEFETAARVAEARAPALLAKWTKPERRAQVVSDLARLFEVHGARMRSSGSALGSEVPDVPALKELVRSMRSLGGAEPEAWRFDLSTGFGHVLDVLGALADQTAFVLPLAVDAKPGADGTLDIALWVWI